MAVLALGFSTRLFLSCTPPPPIEMHFNSIAVVGVDNSGRHTRIYSNIDTMYAGAVAFKLTLFDTTYRYYAFNLHNSLNSLAFSKAMAFSYEQSFIPANRVELLKFTTLLDIDENIKAGDDITDLILFYRGDFELYQNVHSAMSMLNSTQLGAGSSIIFVLTVPVNQAAAQLNVQVTLDNGTVLSKDTKTITILNQSRL